MMSATLSHVAVLVRSLDNAVSYIKELGLETNPYEEFDHEGTRECYVGSGDKSARLLLLEATKDGPYKWALEKRGPGLHHLGVWIPSLEDYAEHLGSAGWLLHTKSLRSMRKLKTVYLARPRVPYLVEAYENVAAVGQASIELLQIAHVAVKLRARTKVLGITNTQVKVPNECKETILTVEGRRIPLNAIIGAAT